MLRVITALVTFTFFVSVVADCEAQQKAFLCQKGRDSLKFEGYVADLIVRSGIDVPANCTMKRVAATEHCTPVVVDSLVTNGPGGTLVGVDLPNELLCYKLACDQDDDLLLPGSISVDDALHISESFDGKGKAFKICFQTSDVISIPPTTP